MTNISVITLLLVWIISLGHSHAQSKDSLALDSSIRYGKLENGFTYYVRPTNENINKVNMELLLKVGGKQEDIDQREMAHFIEHLALTRTLNFNHIQTDHQLLEELNMKPSDIGGKTGGDKTYYWFNYPSKNKKALMKGLLYFQDIVSGKVDFKDEDINGERGAIFEEYLMGDGQSWYKEWKTISLLSNCSKNVKKPDEYQKYIKTFSTSPLKRFYQDWYRPDLMAISIVGNIKDVDAIEKSIIDTFSKIPSYSNPRRLKNCEQEYLKLPKKFLVLEDILELPLDLDPVWNFNFYFRDPKIKNKNLSYLKNEVNKNLFLSMFNHHLKEVQKNYNIPYTISCYKDFTIPAIKLKVEASQLGTKMGIQKAFSVYNNIIKNGFKKNLFEKYKTKNIKFFLKKDINDPLYWKEQIQLHFIKNEPLLEDKNIILKKYLTSLSVEQFNDWLKNYLIKQPNDIAIITPKGQNSLAYNEKTIRHWIKESNENIYKYSLLKPFQLISTKKLALLESSKSIYKKTKSKMGEHKYTLKNGITLILKSFDPSPGNYKDKVMIHLFSQKGASFFPERDYFSAIKSPEIITHSGVGNWNKFQLEKYLENTSLPFGLRPYITLQESGIKGEVDLKDLEIALQLIYLYIKEPRLDKDAFIDWKNKEKQTSLKSSSQAEFLSFVQKQIENPISQKQGLKAKDINIHKAYEIYTSLFQNPKKFTFIMTGRYSINQILPLLTKYLGNLPQMNKVSCKVDKPSKVKTLPRIPLKKTYIPKKNIKNVHIYKKFLKKSKRPIKLQEEIEYSFLATVLNLKLKELRSKKKRAVYLALARSGINRIYNYGFINLIVSCGKEDMDKVENDLKEIISHLKTQGIEQDLYLEVMNSYIKPKYITTEPYKNKQMKKALYEHYRFKVPFPKPHKIDKIINSIRHKDISRIAKKYLKGEFLMEFIAKDDSNS